MKITKKKGFLHLAWVYYLRDLNFPVNKNNLVW